jgi:hypothetical protein
MSADGYVRHTQKAMVRYFCDFKTIEVCISYLCENLLQGPVNASGREPAKYGGLYFGSHEEAVPPGAPNPLIETGAARRMKHVPGSRIRLGFQIERPQDERSILDEDRSRLDYCCHDLNCLRMYLRPTARENFEQPRGLPYRDLRSS